MWGTGRKKKCDRCGVWVRYLIRVEFDSWWDRFLYGPVFVCKECVEKIK
jgi:hypothetical protein